MKIFISYAHVNLPRVQQLAHLLTLGGHDVWFDQRLLGGQSWKEQLRTQIKTSDCFLYALTPESVASGWCQWEFAQAVHMDKKLVTVLLQPCALNGVLGEHQYIDFASGDTLEAGLRLGTAVFAAQPISPELVPLRPAPDHTPPEREIAPDPPAANPLVQRVYDEAFQAYRSGDYDEALELLHDCLLLDAQHVDAHNLLVVIERRMELTRQRAPVRSAHIRVPDLLLGPFAWIDIPAGQVTLTTGRGWAQAQTFEVPAFQIAKYPITNAQFAPFIEAGGYREQRWWTEAGWEAREAGWHYDSGWKPSGQPWIEPRYWRDGKLNGGEQPVVGVSWYEAVAYCEWLSEASGEVIMLPTEWEWQWAAQGNNGLAYPWGNKWDGKRCNNSVSSRESLRTSPVREYEGRGDSPFGVVDMAGNVWEWCRTAYETGSNDLDGTDIRAVRGGAWINFNADYFRAAYRNYADPFNWSFGDGFRCARSR